VSQWLVADDPSVIIGYLLPDAPGHRAFVFRSVRVMLWSGDCLLLHQIVCAHARSNAVGSAACSCQNPHTPLCHWIVKISKNRSGTRFVFGPAGLRAV